MRLTYTTTKWDRTAAVVVALAALVGSAGPAPAAERVVLGEYFTSVY